MLQTQRSLYKEPLLLQQTLRTQDVLLLGRFQPADCFAVSQVENLRHGLMSETFQQTLRTLDNPDVSIEHAATKGFKPDRAIGSLWPFEAVRSRAVDL